jgi:hypothetical protein
VIDKETAYKHTPTSKNRFCNESCWANYEQDKKSPPKEKRDPKPIKNSDLRYLTDYIQELMIEHGTSKERINWELIVKQAKNIIANQEGKCNYVTIRYTLWYMVEIAKINVFDYKEGSILNLVPYHIRDAREYYFEMQSVRASAENFDFDIPKLTTAPVKNIRPKFKKVTF